ncbi:MAG: hypothetical protein DRQ47_10175 [Gammaproteobacteria bacterium]|nr:MAG: hypothetical protein DRQ47_10175 [Gammaproteobacteria bacterium]
MICFIYRSINKADMYLYTLQKDEFSDISEPLLKVFGKPEFSMVIDLKKRKTLARVDIKKVREHLKTDGYYLQMPPSIIPDQNYLTPKDQD